MYSNEGATVFTRSTTKNGPKSIYFLTFLFMAVLANFLITVLYGAFTTALVVVVNSLLPQVDIYTIITSVSIVATALAIVTYEAINPRKKVSVDYHEHHIHLPTPPEVTATEVTFDPPIDINAGEEVEVKVQKKEKKVELNPRTGKPYKLSLARRMELREKALKREQDKRIKKTTENSKKRKAHTK